MEVDEHTTFIFLQAANVFGRANPIRHSICKYPYVPFPHHPNISSFLNNPKPKIWWHVGNKHPCLHCHELVKLVCNLIIASLQ